MALLDLAVEIVAETTFDARTADGPGFVLDAAIAAVRSLLDERGRGDEGIAAIGVGLPLPVFHDGAARTTRRTFRLGHFDVPGYVPVTSTSRSWLIPTWPLWGNTC